MMQHGAGAGQPAIPVAVIGGGPVGLSLAMELAHHGIASTVIEPRGEVSPVRPAGSPAPAAAAWPTTTW